MSVIKRAISWTLFPIWFLLAALIVTCSMLRWKHTSKLISAMVRLVNWNDENLMGKRVGR